MKKTNKKGFTLAELLIVIAIIAVLIAIAIPTFSGALRNARLQTDHANIRSAYAMVMTANMMGTLDVNGTPKATNDSGATSGWYFQKDGTLSADADGAYLLQVGANSGECNASVGCNAGSKYVSNDTVHEKDAKILIKYVTPDSSVTPAVEGGWTLVVKK